PAGPGFMLTGDVWTEIVVAAGNATAGGLERKFLDRRNIWILEFRITRDAIRLHCKVLQGKGGPGVRTALTRVMLRVVQVVLPPSIQPQQQVFRLRWVGLQSAQPAYPAQPQ